MRALLLAALLARPASAEEEKSGFFKSLIKSAAVSAVGDSVPGVTESRIDGAVKVGKAIRQTAQDITEKEEYYIGRAVSAQILARFPPKDDEELNDYVQKVAQAVAASSDRPEISKGYHVQVIESEEPNALSAPGGFIFVTTALLKRLKNEDELAAVLAHELAHISLKHGLKTIKASRLTKAFQLIGAEAAREFSPADVSQLVDLFGGAVDDVVKGLVVSGYSRDKEYEADGHGAELARRANYDPRALSRFIEGLEGGKGGLLKTHPKPKDRLSELAEKDVQPSAQFSDSPARAERFSTMAARL